VLLGKIASQVEPAVKVEGPTRRLEPVAEVGTINKIEGPGGRWKKIEGRLIKGAAAVEKC
jgi:hypothetical protein